MSYLIECFKTCFHKVLCSEYGEEDSVTFTEERLSELRNDVHWELYDTGNTMVPTQLEQLASLVDQVWAFLLFYVNL